MTKKTPEQRIAELDKKRAEIEAKLKAEKEAIIRAKRREQAKILNQKRKEDTRRKILIGALRLDQLNKPESVTLQANIPRKAPSALM
ncbi:hypothetical protein [Marinobacter vinifirmus]|uniref:Mobilization protein n=1 Tax=Marinobacter vinifirmus TaxID=355591 RepID=A0A558B2B6_9GAMM|nr:hypothetical protein [Marinobacter vinifirmus]TVT30613.1 MAG: mobilization protein [Marinobacter vinifirmus]